MGEPRLRGVDVDSTRFLQLHRQILLEKPAVRNVFADTYALCLELDRDLLSGEDLRRDRGGVSFLAEPGWVIVGREASGPPDLCGALALPVRAVPSERSSG
jgi:hypothetical protein